MAPHFHYVHPSIYYSMPDLCLTFTVCVGELMLHFPMIQGLNDTPACWISVPVEHKHEFIKKVATFFFFCMFNVLGASRGFMHDIDELYQDSRCKCCVNNVTCTVYFMLNPIKCDPLNVARCLNKLCVKWLTTWARGRKIQLSH